MMRGSSYILKEKNMHYFKNLIEVISKMDKKLWEIDVDTYTEENVELLLNCKRQIIEALKEKDYNPTDTLATKIMLGVFANIPAFDDNVKNFLSKKLHVRSVNKKSLLKIKEFYEEYKSDFDSFEVYTFDFLTSKKTDIKYTKAKLIDMCGFIYGKK